MIWVLNQLCFVTLINTENGFVVEISDDSLFQSNYYFLQIAKLLTLAKFVQILLTDIN